MNNTLVDKLTHLFEENKEMHMQLFQQIEQMFTGFNKPLSKNSINLDYWYNFLQMYHSRVDILNKMPKKENNPTSPILSGKNTPRETLKRRKFKNAEKWRIILVSKEMIDELQDIPETKKFSFSEKPLYWEDQQFKKHANTKCIQLPSIHEYEILEIDEDASMWDEIEEEKDKKKGSREKERKQEEEEKNAELFLSEQKETENKFSANKDEINKDNISESKGSSEKNNNAWMWTGSVYLIEQIFKEFLNFYKVESQNVPPLLEIYDKEMNCNSFSMLIIWKTLYLLLSKVIDIEKIPEEFIRFNESMFLKNQKDSQFENIKGIQRFGFDKHFFIEGIGQVHFFCKMGKNETQSFCALKIRDQEYYLEEANVRMIRNLKILCLFTDRGESIERESKLMKQVAILRSQNKEYLHEIMEKFNDFIFPKNSMFERVFEVINNHTINKFGSLLDPTITNKPPPIVIKNSSFLLSRSINSESEPENIQSFKKKEHFSESTHITSPDSLFSQIADEVESFHSLDFLEPKNKHQQVQAKVRKIYKMLMHLKDVVSKYKERQLVDGENLKNLQKEKEKLSQAIEMKDLEINEILLKFDELERSAIKFKTKMKQLKKDKIEWEQNKEDLLYNIEIVQKENKDFREKNDQLKDEKEELQKRLERGENERKKIELKKKVMKELHDQRQEWIGDIIQPKNKGLQDIDNEKDFDKKPEFLKNKSGVSNFVTNVNSDASNNPQKEHDPESVKSAREINVKLDNIMSMLEKNKILKENELDFMNLVSKVNFLGLCSRQMSLGCRNQQIFLKTENSLDFEETSSFKKKYRKLKTMLKLSTKQNKKYKTICEEYQEQIKKLIVSCDQMKKRSKKGCDDDAKESDYSVNMSGKGESKRNNSEQLPDTEYRNIFKEKGKKKCTFS